MAKDPITCRNCQHPIGEGQKSISAASGQNSSRTVDFFHADAKGCSDASSAVKPKVTTKSKAGRSSTGEGNRRKADVRQKAESKSKMWSGSKMLGAPKLGKGE